MQGMEAFIGVVKETDGFPRILISIPLIHPKAKSLLEIHGYQYLPKYNEHGGQMLAVWTLRSGFTEVEFIINQLRELGYEMVVADQALLKNNMINHKTVPALFKK